MKTIRCPECGSPKIEKSDELFKCLHCGDFFSEEYSKKQQDLIRSIFGEALAEEKEEKISNIRQNIWEAVNEKYIDSEKIEKYCNELKLYLPDDFFANFYLIACGDNFTALNEFLNNKIDIETHYYFIERVISFVIRRLKYENLLALNNLISRAYEKRDIKLYGKMNNLLSTEAEKVECGVYDTLLTRDVFIAYKSDDMKEVDALVSYLENEEGLSCFVAARNLQHGKISDYDRKLEEAMTNCKVIVFVSTQKSRIYGDARDKELKFIKSRDFELAPAEYSAQGDYINLPKKYKKPRVEYVLENYRGTAAERFVSEFFDGYERCYDKKSVAARVYEILDAPVKVTETHEKKFRELEGNSHKTTSNSISNAKGNEDNKAKENANKTTSNSISENRGNRKKLFEMIKNDSDAYRKNMIFTENSYFNDTNEVERRKRAEIEIKAKEEEKRRAQKAAIQDYELNTLSDEQLEKRGKYLYESNLYSDALNYYQKAAEKGNADAQYFLGKCYYDGNNRVGIKQNYGTAVYWYKKAEEQGHFNALCNIVDACWDNKYGIDDEEKVYWCSKGAEQGYNLAKSHLGSMYLNGLGGLKCDYLLAFDWFLKAAEGGSVNDQFLVGWFYFEGKINEKKVKGFKRNYKKAVYWFLKAAELGHTLAQQKLYNCYINGFGVRKDKAKAEFWLEQYRNNSK